MQNKTCAVTGHRPKGFPWNYYDINCLKHQCYLNNMTYQINELIEIFGFTHFISGGAIGVDMDFAEIIIKLRDNYYSNITIEIAVPCPNQSLKWSIEDKNRYNKILENSNKVTLINKTYLPDCMQQRNEYMVNCSDIVIAFWNEIKKGGTWNTISYCKKKSKSIKIIKLLEIDKR